MGESNGEKARLKVGDVVRRTTGGPDCPMTVVGFHDEGDPANRAVEVAWFNGGEANGAVFAECTLALAWGVPPAGTCMQCGKGPVHPAFEPWRACSLPCVEVELDARFALRAPEAPRLDMVVGGPEPCADCSAPVGEGDPVWWRARPSSANCSAPELVCWECARPALLAPHRQWEEERRQRARELDDLG
jgi:uncharacterized protein YodC (DUF2158 family)